MMVLSILLVSDTFVSDCRLSASRVSIWMVTLANALHELSAFPLFFIGIATVKTDDESASVQQELLLIVVLDSYFGGFGVVLGGGGGIFLFTFIDVVGVGGGGGVILCMFIDVVGVGGGEGVCRPVIIDDFRAGLVGGEGIFLFISVDAVDRIVVVGGFGVLTDIVSKSELVTVAIEVGSVGIRSLPTPLQASGKK